MSFRFTTFCLAIGCIPHATAQPVNFAVPGLGYVFDKTAGSLRPIQGALGAATVGEALPLPSRLKAAMIAPRLGFAIVRADEHANLSLVLNLGGEAHWAELEGVSQEADVVALSNSGRHAAVFSAAEGSLRVISGLPDSASVVNAHEVSGARITAIGISDSGRILVAAFAVENEEGPPASVLRVYSSETSTWQDLGPAARIDAIVFAPNGQDVAVVDGGAASVSLIRNVATGGQAVPLLPQTEGGPIPVAARFLSDSRVLLATKSGIVILNLDDNVRSDIACACTPTGIDDLDNGGAFRLTELSDKPIWIAYDSTEGMRLAFVPPPAAPESAGEGAQ